MAVSLVAADSRTVISAGGCLSIFWLNCPPPPLLLVSTLPAPARSYPQRSQNQFTMAGEFISFEEFNALFEQNPDFGVGLPMDDVFDINLHNQFFGEILPPYSVPLGQGHHPSTFTPPLDSSSFTPHPHPQQHQVAPRSHAHLLQYPSAMYAQLQQQRRHLPSSNHHQQYAPMRRYGDPSQIVQAAERQLAELTQPAWPQHHTAGHPPPPAQAPVQLPTPPREPVWFYVQPAATNPTVAQHPARAAGPTAVTKRKRAQAPTRIPNRKPAKKQKLAGPSTQSPSQNPPANPPAPPAQPQIPRQDSGGGELTARQILDESQKELEGVYGEDWRQGYLDMARLDTE
ncbi:hypothetical protein NA57DRAFT_55092 [Rhizodiscina lignyota]|uniref:Uncharacterized protein n=1 Tax=Rhizodiscina lignyota TaxID=1504668 RepID=A0A9P4IMU9_9PEZI|nr:hypothetical protein NA57DRAFT_55092 [Rhizodiscina lignyota]